MNAHCSFKNPGKLGFLVLIVLVLFFPGSGVSPGMNQVSAEAQMIQSGIQSGFKGAHKPEQRVRTYMSPSHPAAGVFLVAESHLRDPYFGHTVVLIIQHSSKGSLGIIVNRPTSTRLTQIWKNLKGLEKKDDRLFMGGPVNPETFGLLYLGDKKKNNHAPIFENVFYSYNSEHLEPIINGTAGGASAFRVYGGYAGWAPGQLQSELQRGDWRLVAGFPDAIFQADPEAIWSELRAESEQKWIRLSPSELSLLLPFRLLSH